MKMLDNVNAERIITTICPSKLPCFEKVTLLRFRMSRLLVADGMYAQLTRLFYTFYTILGNWRLDRVDCEGKARCRDCDLESVESVDTQVGGHVMSRQERVGMCRR